MPGYTILIMRTNATDRRPLTLRISRWFLWTLMTIAVALPVGGFLFAAGVAAPAWLKLDFNSMKHQVEEAEKVKKEYTSIQSEMNQLRDQVANERKLRAEAETKTMMSETARTEATQKLTQMEVDMVSLKRSVAVYEQLLKPKLDRELLQCVNLEASYNNGQLSYSVNFAKITKTLDLPSTLTARVRIVAGDNAMAMENNSSSNRIVNHPLDPKKDLSLKNSVALNLPPDTTRLLDIKILDNTNKPVGYCWKTF